MATTRPSAKLQSSDFTNAVKHFTNATVKKRLL
ncbi:hypothetical protein FPRO06_01380 [Fusarium proliferatum]|uniref:Uncharacterized protein n=1 Tax=Gibberella intermedia TaxID=948311 RepID=A0A365MT40_GIBIN|nr:hypothetical protein FPRO03_01386 [Fusarium proliferatum]KAG4284627.1 hypothetical protein FPRO04_05009 [Fusarium proliferatum]KAG4294795.1 hypothetical protein FPRO06_01380 [Fusarium proliferatum]RBA11592.1 hypothetical protein FPRO05_04764 [Fusarium proliferatum]